MIKAKLGEPRSPSRDFIDAFIEAWLLENEFKKRCFEDLRAAADVNEVVDAHRAFFFEYVKRENLGSEDEAKAVYESAFLWSVGRHRVHVLALANETIRQYAEHLEAQKVQADKSLMWSQVLRVASTPSMAVRDAEEYEYPLVYWHLRWVLDELKVKEASIHRQEMADYD